MDWDERTQQLIQVAFIDEAENDEVDQTGIFLEPETGNWIILTASGCSCWEGDYEERICPDLTSALATLHHLDGEFNPSLSGIEMLTNQVKQWAYDNPYAD